jgi:hypothetical protein
MATIEGRAFLLKEENKEIKTAFDLAQLCCITESKDEFSSLLAGREVELELAVEDVVHIRLQQRGPPCHQLLQMGLVELQD